jgi:hypothetical protein
MMIEEEVPNHTPGPKIIPHLYIEILYLLQGVKFLRTGLYYRCPQDYMTMALFDSAIQRGLYDKGDTFVLVLRSSDEPSLVLGDAKITRKHFEEITGLKALSDEEYFEAENTHPHYLDVGGIII